MEIIIVALKVIFGICVFLDTVLLLSVLPPYQWADKSDETYALWRLGWYRTPRYSRRHYHADMFPPKPPHPYIYP